MKESATYQAIVEEGVEKGQVKGLRNAILLQGRKKFGNPDNATKAILDSISGIAPLEHLLERMLEVSSWQDLLKG